MGRGALTAGRWRSLSLPGVCLQYPFEHVVCSDHADQHAILIDDKDAMYLQVNQFLHHFAK